jgi:hypothetical protein
MFNDNDQVVSSLRMLFRLSLYVSSENAENFLRIKCARAKSQKRENFHLVNDKHEETKPLEDPDGQKIIFKCTLREMIFKYL